MVQLSKKGVGSDGETSWLGYQLNWLWYSQDLHSLQANSIAVTKINLSFRLSYSLLFVFTSRSAVLLYIT
jgi:hypothetical protein